MVCLVCSGITTFCHLARLQFFKPVMWFSCMSLSVSSWTLLNDKHCELAWIKFLICLYAVMTPGFTLTQQPTNTLHCSLSCTYTPPPHPSAQILVKPASLSYRWALIIIPLFLPPPRSSGYEPICLLTTRANKKKLEFPWIWALPIHPIFTCFTGNCCSLIETDNK